MTRDEWRRVKEIAAGALEEPLSSRAAYLARQCTTEDETLRREVESLVESAVKATDLYETPTILIDSAQATLEMLAEQETSRVGERIGAYRIVGQLGVGGMGAAYLAGRADDAFEKRVAIKLVKRGMDTDAILRRFLHERQILASLDHPNIARLLDGGTTADGLPYFIMEYVDGQPIDTFCDTHQLSVPERLRLFQAALAAVEHAHENLVIHRDLKPANILVTSKGVPKLLDFGIAKLLDVDRTLHTRDGTTVAHAMTLEYASPEQIRGEEVTKATDVYSLGVLLYELLTGRNPQSAAGRSPRETERVICEEMPPRPSTVVEAHAGQCRGTSREALRRQLSGDLDAIVLMALQKEPGRRYPSVQALADDIERHLEGQPIQARADGLGTRVARRLLHTKVLAPAAAVLGLLGMLLYPSLVGRTTTAPQTSSIAVLPLSTGESQDLAFLAEGITDNVIGRLSRVSRLKVIARDSVYRYAGRDLDPRQAGRELGVQTVVIGRITERNGALTLQAELVDARDGSRLWGDQYVRPMADVQFVQAELAQQIVKQLQLRLSSSEQTRVAQTDGVNPEAYQLYLRGRYFWNKRTRRDFQRSVAYFTQAVAKDPSFALAYTGLADSYGLLTDYHAVPARDTYGAAKAASLRALAIDDELAEAHTSLAYIRQYYEWDWPGAEAEFRRALEIHPGYATAHQWYADLLSVMGRHREAIAEIRRATEADPLSLIVNSAEANILYMARQYDGALEVCRRVIELDPNFPQVYEYLKRSYDQKGQYGPSIQARQTRRRLLGLNADLTPALRDAASASSSRLYWRKRLEQELLEGQTEGLQPFEMAEILGQAGDNRQALDWLEKACREDDFMITTIAVAPNLDPLRSEPRFKAILTQRCRTGG